MIALFVYKLICYPVIKLSKIKGTAMRRALIFHLKLWYRCARFIAKPFISGLLAVVS